jgi:hypothetical protein
MKTLTKQDVAKMAIGKLGYTFDILNKFIEEIDADNTKQQREDLMFRTLELNKLEEELQCILIHQDKDYLHDDAINYWYDEEVKIRNAIASIKEELN